MDDVIERVMRTYALMVALTPADERLRGNVLGNF